MERETRIWRPEITQLRIEPTEDGKSRVTGLAVPYGQTSEDLGGFREIFASGAFRDSLADGSDVLANVEHDDRQKLGRRKTGTVELRDGEDGLRVAITLPATRVGQDTAEEVRAGLLDGMSIEFREPESQWMGRGADTIRKVVKATLTGVALTAFPAYRQTIGTVTLRSLDAHQKQQEAQETPPDDGGLDLCQRRQRLAECE